MAFLKEDQKTSGPRGSYTTDQRRAAKRMKDTSKAKGTETAVLQKIRDLQNNRKVSGPD